MLHNTYGNFTRYKLQLWQDRRQLVKYYWILKESSTLCCQRCKPVRKVAALTPTFLHGATYFFKCPTILNIFKIILYKFKIINTTIYKYYL